MEQQEQNKCQGCQYLLSTCCGENLKCGYGNKIKDIPVVCPINKW